MAACSTLGAVSTVAKVAEVALEAAGLKKPDPPPGPPPPKFVPLRIHAGDNLNAGGGGRGFAVVTKLYKLRDPTAFMQAPYDVFTNPTREKDAFGSDLLEVRELVLLPGQRFETKERMTSDMPYLGVVTLFRSPAPERWRFAFAQADIEKNGVTMGAHACALTVTEGKVQGTPANSPALLSPIQCPQ